MVEETGVPGEKIAELALNNNQSLTLYHICGIRIPLGTLPMETAPFTTTIVSSNPTQAKCTGYNVSD
jgi:hypothetical protein